MEFVRRSGAVLAPPRPRSRDLTRQQGTLRLLVITLTGVLLRVLTLNSRSFWLDEATSVRQASWTLPILIDRMSANVHPPLFHFLLHYWIRYAGRSEIAVRAFPLLFGIAAIPLAYWAGTAIYNRRVGAFAAGIIAFAPFLIWYSQEARMYMMMLVFALASTGAMYRAMVTREPGWWALYALSTAAGLFTQYFFGFLYLTQALYVLVFLVIKRERDLKAAGLRRASWSRPWMIFADCPEATAWLACMPFVLMPIAWWMTKTIPHLTGKGELFQSLSYGTDTSVRSWHFNEIILAAGQAVFGMHSDTVTRNISAMWPLVITVAFLISGRMRRVSPRTWFLIHTGVFSASIVAVIGQFAPVYEVRYFMAVGGPAAILVARFLVELRAPTLQVVCAALIALSLLAYVDQSYDPDSIVKWDNREAAAAVSAGYKPGDVIVLVPYYASSILEYYLPPQEYFAVRRVPLFNPDGKPRNDRTLLAQDLTRQLGPAIRVWVVSTFYETPRIQMDQDNVVAWLEARGFRRTEYLQLRRIRVSLYEGPQAQQFFVDQGGGQ